MPSSDRTLPDKFKFINTLQSADLRHKLSEMIFSLYDLLEDYEMFDPNLTARELVERFFAYLTKTCKSQDAIYRRAEWALKYGEIVEDRLLLMRSKRINATRAQLENVDRDLLDRLENLSNAIAVHRITDAIPADLDADIIKTLDHIQTLCVQVIPDKFNITYNSLAGQMDEFTTLLTQRAQSGTKGDGGELILVQLLELKYAMSRYLLRYGSHRK